MRKLALLAAALFVVAASWLGRPVGGLWNSPDETANAFWSARVAAGSPLAVADAAVAIGAGAVHPRSMAVADGALVPGSFPGLFLLFGALKLFFRLPLFVYAPVLTGAAGLCFGLLAAKLFGRKAGLIAALLFFVHPAVLYYGSRGLFHNILFLDLLIFAAALFALRPLSKVLGTHSAADDAFGGFVLGWALLTRASEAVWALPAFAAFLPWAGTDRWRRLAFAALGALVPLLLFLRINDMLYGSPFRTAYVAPATAPSIVVETTVPVADAVLEATPSAPSAALLPFGVHPRLAAKNAWNYGLKLFWWASLLSAVGFAWWLRERRAATGPQKTYAAVALAASAWLVLLYGSWFVRDRFDPEAVTIGTSYVRYFLPIYAAALPFAGFALVRLGERLRLPVALPAVAVLLTMLLGVRSAVIVGDESLRAVRRTMEGNVLKKEALLSWIERDATVMTERFDKLLVPDVLRIIPSADAAGFAAAARTAEISPTYWYGLDPDADETARLAALAAAQGLALIDLGSPTAGERLYRLEPPEGPELLHDHAHDE